MAAAVDEYGAMAGGGERRDLIAPIAAVAEPAMQQDHGRAGAIGRVPDAGAVIVHVALLACRRQRRSALRFEFFEVVVVWFHPSNPVNECDDGHEIF